MTVTCGKVLGFLCMNIFFTENKSVEIGMEDYVKTALEDFNFPFTTSGTTTPAQHALFDIDPKSPKLSHEQSDLFTNMLQSYFICLNVGVQTYNWRSLS